MDANIPTIIAALFTRAKTWKKPRCPLTDEGTNKTCHRHTTGLLRSLKKEESPTHATTWMNLENMLSEINESQKDKYCVIPLT